MSFKNITKKLRTIYILLIFVTVVLALLVSNVSHPIAQQAYFWSGQKKIPEYEIYNNEQPPYLVADNNHKIYAFNSQFLGETDKSDSPKAVFYREWTLTNGWTSPNDILVDPNGSIELLGVTNDESGKAHLIFQNHLQEIYYSQTFLAASSDPQNWPAPISIGENSLHVRFGIPTIAAISADKTGGRIMVIYSGVQYGSGLYFTYSTDSGNTWSVPYPVYLTGDETMVVTSPSIYMGDSGFFHAVWSTFDNKGFGGPGFYASFDLNLGAWSEPMELDTPGIRTPSVIEYKGDIFVSYHHISTNGRWWRRSTDGGKTWTDPIQLSSRHVGTNGGVSFVVDSNETLHAFFGGRIDDNNHGMWNSIWNGITWSNPEAVVKGPGIKDVDGGENNFDPTYARAIVSNGNVILVSWGTDGAVGSNGAWYSYKQLNAPELQAQPLPMPNIIPGIVSTATLPLLAGTNDIERTPVSISNNYDNSPPSLRDPQSSILLGVIPVILMLLGIIIVRYVFYSQKR